MANIEWKNREERRGIHNREDWCCGWMAGFLSEDKPNWRKEQIGAAEKRGFRPCCCPECGWVYRKQRKQIKGAVTA
jgi:hypothetical protein